MFLFREDLKEPMKELGPDANEDCKAQPPRTKIRPTPQSTPRTNVKVYCDSKGAGTDSTAFRRVSSSVWV